MRYYLFCNPSLLNVLTNSLTECRLLLSSRSSVAETCFETTFPKILGGTSDSINFNSMDMDTSGNFIIGGGCADPQVINQLHTNTEPCLVYIIHGGLFQWGKSFTMQDDFEYVAAVKFSPAGERIVLSFEISSAYSYNIVVLNAVDGSIHKIYSPGTFL